MYTLNYYGSDATIMLWLMFHHCRVKLKHFAKFTDMTDALSGENSTFDFVREDQCISCML